MSRRETTGGITVEFDLHDGTFDAFCALISKNATQSVAEEAGCLRFDILLPAGATQPQKIFLYEIYTDRAAFNFHLASEHFNEFDKATRDMISAKRIHEYQIIENSKPPRATLLTAPV